MTAQEFIEWQAFYGIDPWGGYRQDLQSANICSIIANVNRGENTQPYALEDFTLFQRYPAPPEEVDQEALNQGILSIFGNYQPAIADKLKLEQNNG